MKKFLAFLAVLMWAPGVWAVPSVTKIPELSQKGYAVESVSGESGVFTIGPTYPFNLIGFELGSSFVGNLYACESPQTVAIPADTCDLVTALSADIGPPLSFQTTRLWFVLEITTPEGAGTTSRVTIRGSSDQISGATPDQVDVLIGGVDGIPDVANPNTAPQICAQADNACFYKSSDSGWWMALGGDQVSTTTWASANVTTLYDYYHEVNNVNNLPNAGACVRLREQNALDSSVTCGAVPLESQLTVMRDTTLIAWEYGISIDFAGDAGCQIGITEDGGSNLLDGATFDIPSAQGGSTNAGVVTLFPIGLEMTAGNTFEPQFGNSLNCEDGAACVGCVGGVGAWGGRIRLLVLEHG